VVYYNVRYHKGSEPNEPYDGVDGHQNFSSTYHISIGGLVVELIHLMGELNHLLGRVMQAKQGSGRGKIKRLAHSGRWCSGLSSEQNGLMQCPAASNFFFSYGD